MGWPFGSANWDDDTSGPAAREIAYQEKRFYWNLEKLTEAIRKRDCIAFGAFFSTTEEALSDLGEAASHSGSVFIKASDDFMLTATSHQFFAMQDRCA